MINNFHFKKNFINESIYELCNTLIFIIYLYTNIIIYVKYKITILIYI